MTDETVNQMVDRIPAPMYKAREVKNQEEERYPKAKPQTKGR